MKVHLKCLSSLSEGPKCDHQRPTTIHLPDGSTVGRVMAAAGVSENDVKIIFVNGKISRSRQNLNDNDGVTLVPATGGM